MPKTKNAFAFRDFDATRILQRPFFKSLNLPNNKPDVYYLQTDDNLDLPAIQAMADRNDQILARLDGYIAHINSHGARIGRFMRLLEQQSLSNDKADLASMRQQYERAIDLLIHYTGRFNQISWSADEPITIFVSKTTPMVDHIKDIRGGLFEATKTLWIRERNYYRYKFAERLIQARRELGLSQTALGKKIGVPQPRVSDYEKMLYEPNLTVLIKLADVLHKPVDWLLGTK